VKVRCIDAHEAHGLTKGKIYELNSEKGLYYRLENDDRMNGIQGWYKNRFEIVEENEDMKKSDLKSGMIVEWRDGRKAMVLKSSE
jgi:hypothetical protein